MLSWARFSKTNMGNCLNYFNVVANDVKVYFCLHFVIEQDVFNAEIMTFSSLVLNDTEY